MRPNIPNLQTWTFDQCNHNTFEIHFEFTKCKWHTIYFIPDITRILFYAWYRLCIFHIYKIYQIFQMTFRYLWQKFDPLMNEPQCQKIFSLCTSHVLVCSPRKVKFWYLPCIFHISIIDAHKIQIYVRYFGQECALNSEDMQLCIPCTSYVQVNKMENNLISRAASQKNI